MAPWLPESQRQNETVIDVIAHATVGYALGGNAVVVDGIVGPWFLERFIKPLTEASVPASYVVLRPSEETALARATSRGAEALIDEAPIRKMYREFANLDAYESHVFDSSNMTPAASVEAIRRRLGDGLYRVC